MISSSALSREEERTLFGLWREQGDRYAHDRLARSQEGWGKLLAQKFCSTRRWRDYAEALSAANYGIREAIATFKLEKNCRLTTHTYCHVSKWLWQAYWKRHTIQIPPNACKSKFSEDAERAKRIRRIGPREKWERGSDFQHPTYTDDPLLKVIEDDRVKTLRTALEQLDDPRDTEIIRRHFIGGELLREIGKDIGISKQRVSELKDRALLRLRQRLEEMNIHSAC